MQSRSEEEKYLDPSFPTVLVRVESEKQSLIEESDLTQCGSWLSSLSKITAFVSDAGAWNTQVTDGLEEETVVSREPKDQLAPLSTR